MEEPKNYFNFNREQRIGLLLLIGLVILIQIGYFFIDFSSKKPISKENQAWLNEQVTIDSIANLQTENTYKIYPFNPNFITDFKGYKLGMSNQEIDRLLAFRKTGKFVNSVQEFQNVTKVSNELLAKISPYFKFPDWVTNKKNNSLDNSFANYTKEVKEVIQKDINQATKEDLMSIFGVGDAISERIIKQRAILGAFVSMKQMDEVWGLSPEVIYELNKHYKIGSNPNTIKIDINNASTKELMKLTYFKYPLAREIVTYRSMNNGINSVEDLEKINGFPIDKIKIIALYLDFKK